MRLILNKVVDGKKIFMGLLSNMRLILKGNYVLGGGGGGGRGSVLKLINFLFSL